MKKLLNKKILTVFVIGVLAVGMPIFINSAFAAGAYFNTDPADKPTLRTGNYSTYGPSCTTCWSGSTMANAGDIVSFDIYYHNASADTATQTRVKANIPTGNYNSFTVSADLYASNATAITGTSLVSLSSTQNLTFIPGSVLWYPNQSLVPVALLYSQTGDEIITTNGLNIGDVSAGWGTQGHVTFRVQVGGGQQQGQTPTVITNSATSIAQNNATFNASINPNGNNTTAWFEYGTTQSLGSTIGSQTIGSGNTSINISTYLSGLLSNTTYYYRIAASNQYGTSYGSILNFTTSQSQSGQIPIVITNSANSIYQNSATLNSSINPNNSNTTTWFEYGTTQSFGYTVGNQSIGSGNTSINISYQINNLLSNTTYYYRAIASNSYGVSYGSTLSFMTQSQQSGQTPIITTNSATSITQNYAVLNASVNPNNSNTNIWFEYGTTQSLGYTIGSQSVGSGNYNINITSGASGLLSNTTYYYRAIASNSYGTSYGSTYSFTTSNQAIQGSAPVVTTNSATIFFTNSTLLNGSVNANGAITTAWFEYGTTLALGQTTNSQPMGMGTIAYNYSYILSNLTPNAIYYFRAIAQNAYGTSYGTILSFVSPAATAATITTNNASLTAIIKPTASSNSLAMVLVSNVDKLEVIQGNEINYTAVYKNISGSDIADAKINITLPEGVDYQSANIDYSSQSEGNIMFNIGKILANGQGSVSVKTKINNSAKVGELVLNANMNYIDSKNINQLVEASSTIMVKDTKANSNLTASLLDTMGLFFGSWLFNIVLLGMVLGLGVYVIRYLKQ